MTILGLEDAFKSKPGLIWVNAFKRNQHYMHVIVAIIQRCKGFPLTLLCKGKMFVITFDNTSAIVQSNNMLHCASVDSAYYAKNVLEVCVYLMERV